MADTNKKEDVLLYKGRPLRRCKNEIYYGDLSEKYIVAIQILDSEKKGELDIGGKMSVSLMLTDSEIRLKDRIVKHSEKQGLYNPLDIGSIWLERALAQK